MSLCKDVAIFYICIYIFTTQNNATDDVYIRKKHRRGYS